MKIDMDWARGSPVTDKDGRIQLGEVSGYYNPFDFYFPGGEDRSLYLRLADVKSDDKAAILEFVQNFGVLGTGARNSLYWSAVKRVYAERTRKRDKAEAFMTGFDLGLKQGTNAALSEAEATKVTDARRTVRVWSKDPNRVPPHFPAAFDDNEVWLSPLGHRMVVGWSGDSRDDFDTFKDFWREVELMKGLIYLWRETREPGMDVEGVADWASTLDGEIYSDEHFIRLLDTTRYDYLCREEERLLTMPAEQLRSHAESAISTFVQNQLATGLLLEVKCKDGQFLQQWNCDTLITSLYFMVAMDLAGASPPRRCANPKCERFFVPSRPSKIYCSETCQTQDRVRRWRQNKVQEEDDPTCKGT